jgi:hypothetical protein
MYVPAAQISARADANRFAQKERAQRTPGASRARSLACENKKHTSIVTAVAAETSGIPCAVVLTAYFVLSPAIGLSCHRRRRDAKASLPT